MAAKNPFVEGDGKVTRDGSYDEIAKVSTVRRAECTGRGACWSRRRPARPTLGEQGTDVATRGEADSLLYPGPPGFLAGLWLKFLTGGALRGNLYDALLVFVLASATFSTRNRWLLGSAEEEAIPGSRRRCQSALNRTSVVAWAATGKDVLGRFDPVDLAC